MFKIGLIFIHNFFKGNFGIHIMNFVVTYYNSVTEMPKIWGTLHKLFGAGLYKVSS